jgi:hypothetical protein
MRPIAVLLVLLFLNNCTSIKECNVKPTVTIKKEKNSTESNSDTKTTPSTVIQDIRENATGGGQINCSF